MSSSVKKAAQRFDGYDEPDLSNIVESGSDRLTIRNIMYTAWSLFNRRTQSSSATMSPYTGWDVKRIGGESKRFEGYMLMIHFGKYFTISLQEMQVISCFVLF
jgi:hypothetical protein